MLVLSYATTIWGLVMALSPLLQARQVLHRRDSTGVSAGFPLVLLVGFLLWLAYGVSIGSPPLVVTNIVNVVMYGFTLAVVLWYRPRRRAGSHAMAPPASPHPLPHLHRHPRPIR